MGRAELGGVQYFGHSFLLDSNWNWKSTDARKRGKFVQSQVRINALAHFIQVQDSATGQAEEMGEGQLALLVLDVIKTKEVKRGLEERLGIQGRGRGGR